MSNIKESAQAWMPKQTKNIADLPEVSVDLQISEDPYDVEEKDGTIKTVNQKVVNINGENYRIPESVLEQLQSQLKDRPGLKKFRVDKKGTGLGTKYTVIPLDTDVVKDNTDPDITKTIPM